MRRAVAGLITFVTVPFGFVISTDSAATAAPTCGVLASGAASEAESAVLKACTLSSRPPNSPTSRPTPSRLRGDAFPHVAPVAAQPPSPREDMPAHDTCPPRRRHGTTYHRAVVALAVSIAATVAALALSGTPSTAATHGDFTVSGIDVSHNQGTINWTAVSGTKQFAFAKATEGLSFVDPMYQTNRTNARAAGVLFGGYAFARPDEGDPAGQADKLVATSQYEHDGQTLPPMVDLEDEQGLGFCYGLSPTAMVGWIRTFTNEIRTRTGQPTVIYTRTSWWDPCTASSTAFSDNLLFVSQFTSGSLGALPAGWSTFTFWQWSDAGSSPGVASTVDLDVYNGSIDALHVLAGAPSAVLGGAVGAVARDGRYDVFGRVADGRLLQWTYLNSAWHGPTDLGGPIISAPAVTVDAAGRFDVFAVGSDHSLIHRIFDGTWHDWEHLGGVLHFGVAVVHPAPGRFDVFSVDTDHHLVQKIYQGGAWSPWSDLGGVLSSAPGVVSVAGRYDVFATDTDHHLVQKSYNGSTWTGFIDLGGVLTVAPAAVNPTAGRYDIFAANTDHDLIQKIFNGVWNPWHIITTTQLAQ